MMVKTIETFDLLKSPLSGANLIEASAGTGKTYTIAGLYLRLILEKRLSVEDILVVTFTVAATDELRHRIRRFLRQALTVLSGESCDDVFITSLCQQYRGKPPIIRRVHEAIQEFDGAAIFTIHGFCQKVLQQYAFESGTLFDTELLPDEGPLLQEVAEDFWRTHFVCASPLFAAYALKKKFTPAYFNQLLRSFWTILPKRIIPEPEIPDLSRLEASFEESLEKLRREWPINRQDAAAMLCDPSAGLDRRTYKVKEMGALLAAMDRFILQEGGCIDLFKNFERLTSTKLRQHTRKECIAPASPLFDVCDSVWKNRQQLCQAYDQALLALKRMFFIYAAAELCRRKQARNVQCFSDLLLNVQAVLESGKSASLIQRLRRRYRAALIDEFQDTDPVQYAIFQQLFQTPDSVLFLIGDPKQAIYGFRGADIFTYLEATRQVQHRYTLQNNWRAVPALITATNAIFSCTPHPFIYSEIPFTPASAPPEKHHEPLRIEDREEAPLHCWLMDTAALPGEMLTGDKNLIKKSDARELIEQAVGSEIIRLLHLGEAGQATIGSKPVHAGDIAVLVRTNDEATRIQAHLASRGIPSVLYVTDDLFNSHEAYEMERLLAGIAGLSDERLFISALATDILGLTAREIENIQQEEQAWEDRIRRFQRYHDMWRWYGFMRMIRQLMVDEKVKSRLVSFSDGERRLTNFLHLAEVLHTVATERRLEMNGLVKWLSAQRSQDSLRLEEHQLRLESDAHAVKVATIHRSKGLEYPIVFCPFLWGGLQGRRLPGITFHADDSGNSLTLDLGSPDEGDHRQRAEQERLAEDLRLLYVALTRAKNRCTIVWGRFNDAHTSALAYCLHFGDAPGEGTVLDSLAARYERLTNEELKTMLKMLAQRAKGSIGITGLPPGGIRYTSVPAAVDALQCRHFTGHIDGTWRIMSFSSLTAGKEQAEIAPDLSDAADYDGSVAHAPGMNEEASGIYAFPRGTQAGLVIHEIFQDLDFSEPDPEAIRQIVAGKLQRYGFEEHWILPVCDMVTRVVSAPLTAEGLKLVTVRLSERISELEFTYPIASLSAQKLANIVRSASTAKAAGADPSWLKLDFQPGRGFMKGFIDLVFRDGDRFYVVDWKSNLLGLRPEEYDSAALQKAMIDHWYELQYHIYVLALHRYLQVRLPGYCYDKHFGGVFYLFVRGIDPRAGAELGIYRARPDEEVIEALDRELIQGTVKSKE